MDVSLRSDIKSSVLRKLSLVIDDQSFRESSVREIDAHDPAILHCEMITGSGVYLRVLVEPMGNEKVFISVYRSPKSSESFHEFIYDSHDGLFIFFEKHFRAFVDRLGSSSGEVVILHSLIKDLQDQIRSLESRVREMRKDDY